MAQSESPPGEAEADERDLCDAERVGGPPARSWR